MEDSTSAIAPLILRNLLTSIFIHADKPLIHLVQKFRLVRILRRFLVSAFLFFLGLLPSLFPSLRSSAESHDHDLNPKKDDSSSASGFRYGGRSGLERALTQLLLIMNDIPVSSRKYEVVRSLAEKLIEENLSEKNQEALKEVNCAVLAAAFGRTLSQLESAVVEQRRRSWNDDNSGGGGEVTTECRGNDHLLYTKASRLFRGVRYCGQLVWSYAKPRDELSRSRSSAEKLAAEILWLAQKMAASGCAAEAVCKWAASSNLAWLALATEPRLQGSLVKVSAFLIKQAKELGSAEKELRQQEEPHNDTRAEQQKTRQIKMKMLISWLPLLCAANNGTDAPVVNTSERAELEKIMEDIIWTLDEDHEEQERVLSVWLHHFSYCSASDWPNLRLCYTRWFGASRTRLLQATPAGQRLGSN